MDYEEESPHHAVGQWSFTGALYNMFCRYAKEQSQHGLTVISLDLCP